MGKPTRSWCLTKSQKIIFPIVKRPAGSNKWKAHSKPEVVWLISNFEVSFFFLLLNIEFFHWLNSILLKTNIVLFVALRIAMEISELLWKKFKYGPPSIYDFQTKARLYWLDMKSILGITFCILIKLSNYKMIKIYSNVVVLYLYL